MQKIGNLLCILELAIYCVFWICAKGSVPCVFMDEPKSVKELVHWFQQSVFEALVVHVEVLLATLKSNLA